MDNISIDRHRDVIVVEKVTANTIDKGTRFYCGCCGGVLGKSKKKMCFPFSVDFFNASLKDKSFTINRLGLRHDKCGHTMFTFKDGYSFISLSAYAKQVPQNDSK